MSAPWQHAAWCTYVQVRPSLNRVRAIAVADELGIVLRIVIDCQLKQLAFGR